MIVYLSQFVAGSARQGYYSNVGYPYTQQYCFLGDLVMKFLFDRGVWGSMAVNLSSLFGPQDHFEADSPLDVNYKNRPLELSTR